MRTTAWAAVLTLAACGPAVSTQDTDPGTTSGTGSSTGTPRETSTSTGPHPTTSATSVGSTSAPDPTTGAAESSTSTGGADTCEDIPSVANGRLSVDREVFDDASLDLDEVCIVTDVDTEDEQQQVRVGCRSDVLLVTLSHVPPLALSPGQELRVQVQRNFPIDFGGYEHVVLRQTDGELLAATHSTREPAGFDAEAFFAPFSASLVHGVCAVVPHQDDEDTTAFIVDPCAGDTERLAFDASDGTRTVRVLSGQVAPLGDLVFQARTAMQLDPVDPLQCPVPRPHALAEWGVFQSR